MQKFVATRVARAIERPVIRVVRVLLVVLFSLMLGLSILQITLRFFFGTSILWADQAARDLVLWCGLLGSVLATQANKHFNIDVVTRFLTPHARRWFRVLAEVLAAIVCCGLVRASIDFFIRGVSLSVARFIRRLFSGGQSFLPHCSWTAHSPRYAVFQEYPRESLSPIFLHYIKP
jgi:TRAP-type C4-dicarboxylate transport system permease small subunit